MGAANCGPCCNTEEQESVRVQVSVQSGGANEGEAPTAGPTIRKVTAGALQVGDHVIFKRGLGAPTGGWGKMSAESVGRATEVSGSQATVEFHDCGPWTGPIVELETCEVCHPFHLEVCSAMLVRSFAKIGSMDPFAIVKANGKVILETEPHRRGHKEPIWSENTTYDSPEGHPESITIEVWDRNKFHRNVFCGNVTIPCSDDMGQVTDDIAWELMKKGKVTGHIHLNIRCGLTRTQAKSMGNGTALDVIDGALEESVSRKTTGASTRSDKRAKTVVRMSPTDHPDDADHEEGEGDDGKQAEEGELKRYKTVENVGSVSNQMTCILGSWKCTDTWGMDEFLQDTGVGMWQRKLVAAMKWPGWEYIADGDKMLFINHSAMGDLKENIQFDAEYTYKDGKGNVNKSRAVWKGDSEAGLLKCSKSIEGIGEWTEEREVTGDLLKFTLNNGKVSWGRTFEREL